MELTWLFPFIMIALCVFVMGVCARLLPLDRSTRTI